jgi:long-chain acyl-CoA synthetase
MRGVHVFRGYWRQPDATASSLVNGWFRTGDIGHLDEEGFLYIEDRLKDVILRGGENIYCAEVEAVLHEHDGIRDVAVFGLADARLGEEVAAAVVLKAGSAVSAEDLADFTAGRLAPFKVPSRWFIVAGQLPRSAVGKVLKRELQKRFSSAPDGDQAARHVRS